MSPARPPEGANSLSEGQGRRPKGAPLSPARPPEGANSLSEGQGRRPKGAPVTPPAMPVRTALVVLVLGGSVFTALAADLLWHGPVTAADAAFGAWLRALARPAVTAPLWLVSELHGTRVLLAMAALAAVLLAWRGQTTWLPPLVLCVPGGMLLNSAVKHGFQRARPALDGAVELGSYSFPSGHAAGATVWWGFVLVWLLAHLPRPRERLAACILAVSMVALTALSRVYLGAHFASDVLAAIGEGAAWVAFTFLVLGRRVGAPPAPHR